MSFVRGRWRARPQGVWLFVFLALTFGVARTLPGQVRPAPGDTVPQDTVLVPIPSDIEPGDTVPTVVAEAAESSAPLSVVPRYPDPLPIGWAPARWEITAEQLGRLPGLTLLEILERLPGFVGFRAGGFGRPEGLTALGLGGSRLRVFLDGLEMVPIGAGVFELESISLLDIDRVVVERSSSEIRVDVRTFRLDQPEAHSTVELGTGIYETRLLRALFSRGFGGNSIGTGAFDLVTTRGTGIREPYSHSSAIFRYAYALGPSTSLQAEWRRVALDRQGTVFPRQTTRTDFSLRGRSVWREDFVVEAVLARVSQEEGLEEAGRYSANSTQAVVRGAFDGPRLGADASIRVRGSDDVAPPLASLDAEARVMVRPLPLLQAEATGRFASGGGIAATSGSTTATFTPVPGLSAFGTLSAGRRLLGAFGGFGGEEGNPVGQLFTADVTGLRAGAELSLAGVDLGVAAFENGGGLVAPFGLPFDANRAPVDEGGFTGIEGSFVAAVPGTGRRVSLEGWFASIPDAQSRMYTPRDLARIGFLFHGLYYGGQLEPSLRIEGLHHGQASVPDLRSGSASNTEAPGYQTLNLSLQIRIIDVEAFLLWDNLLNSRSAIDFPGVPPAYPRIVYGAEWRFRG